MKTTPISFPLQLQVFLMLSTALYGSLQSSMRSLFSFQANFVQINLSITSASFSWLLSRDISVYFQHSLDLCRWKRRSFGASQASKCFSNLTIVTGLTATLGHVPGAKVHFLLLLSDKNLLLTHLAVRNKPTVTRTVLRFCGNANSRHFLNWVSDLSAIETKHFVTVTSRYM